MPQLERWDSLPEGVRQHLIERMRDRAISISDLNQLRLWVERRLKCPTVIGTRISALSRSAAADRTPKRSWSEGKLQRVKPSDQSASTDSSSVVAKPMNSLKGTPALHFTLNQHSGAGYTAVGYLMRR